MSYPKPAELWKLDPDEFNKWRRENDLQILFEKFTQCLPHFNQWLKENDLSIEFILKTDQPGQFFYWDKETYLITTTGSNFTRYSFAPIENADHENRILKISSINQEGEHSELQKFTPYLFWVKSKHGIDKPIKTNRNEFETFRQVGGTAPDVPEQSTSIIAPGIQVLKLGGTTIDGWWKLNYRNLDFTDLDYLTVEGKDSFGRSHQIFYTTCQNILAKGVEADFTEFYQCEFRNLQIVNSRLNGLQFFDCDIFKATFENSSIANLIIVKGSANSFSFNRVEVENIIYEPPKREWHCGITHTYETISDNYKRFRILYQSNGLRQEASESYYKERLYETKSHLSKAKSVTSLLRFRRQPIKHIFLSFGSIINYFSQALSGFISYSIWGFGERPFRIFAMSFLTLLLYATIYFYSDISKVDHNFLNSLYLSIVTFTTLGFGDITPVDSNTYKLIVASEALIGAFSLGLLVAGYANKSRY